jgi:hypothetical protein
MAHPERYIFDQGGSMNFRNGSGQEERSEKAGPETATDQKTRNERESIPESVAEDHARLLSMLGRCLAEVGIGSALTTFHKIVLRAESFHRPTRYEPELDVFWPDDDRPGIALKIKLAERRGQIFYAWGRSWTCDHPAGDLLGTIQAIAGHMNPGR